MPGSKSLSVALVYDDSLDGNEGVAQQVKRLGEYLSRKGHKVVYLAGETSLQNWSGGKVYSLSKNMHVRFNGNRLSMPILSSRRAIRNVLKAEQPNILHVMTPYSPFMAQRVITAASRQKIAVVGSFHILPSGWMSSFGARLLGLAQFFSLKKVSAFTSTSQNAGIFARQTMRISSVVVPNMVDIGSLRSGRKVGNRPNRIVFLGRLVERKGCKQLIQAFAEVTKFNPKAELVIAGDGPDRASLERLTSDLKLSKQVKFLGFIDEADKPKVLGSAKIACFPALYGESFGLVLAEAMAAGAGVVLGGNNPGYRSVLQDQPDLLFNPRDKDELAAKLINFLSNDKLVQEMNRWQTKHVKQYDVAVVGRQMEAIYQQAIAKVTTGRHN